MIVKCAAGWALLAAGLLLVVPQVVALTPNQTVFSLGLVVAIAGGLLLADSGVRA